MITESLKRTGLYSDDLNAQTGSRSGHCHDVKFPGPQEQTRSEMFSDSLTVFSLPLLIFILHPIPIPDTMCLPGSVSGRFLCHKTLVKSLWLIIEETEAWIINRAMHLFVAHFMLAPTLLMAHGQFLKVLGWICTCGVCRKSCGHNVGGSGGLLCYTVLNRMTEKLFWKEVWQNSLNIRKWS